MNTDNVLKTKETDPAETQLPQAVEEVAITGSPNTVTEIQFDVRSTHLRTPLLGTLLTLNVPVHIQEAEEELLVLAQVATIETQNRWHEDPSLKNYIKLHGRLPHLTEIGDVTTGRLQIIGGYHATTKGNTTIYEKTRLPVPPGSGLAIKQVDRKLIESIMAEEFGYAYLGSFYGTEDVPAPVYVRHFGDFKDNGSGEAYMGGVFGPSGSGKSVIAATLVALWASNSDSDMGILILDPQSEFSENAFARGTSFKFDFHDMLQKTSGKRFIPRQHVIRLDQLQLEGSEMFVQVLIEKDFFDCLGLGSSSKVTDAAEYVIRFLDSLENVWKPWMSWTEVNNLQIMSQNRNRTKQQQENDPPISFGEAFTKEAANSYAMSSRAKQTHGLYDVWQTQDANLERIWNETADLFKPKDSQGQDRHRVLQIIEDTLMKGEIRILDLNPKVVMMSQRFKLYLMDFIFRKLRQITHKNYRDNRPGNCLIVLDEAGRYIPQDPGDDEMLRRLSAKLTDSVKEMRKMRCGFLFITQTIAEIQKEIFRNLHFRIYGVGLGVGVDADHIKAREGDEAFELYRSLPDPRLSGTYSFMVAGVLLALGSSGRPMVIEGFPSGQAVLDANQHIQTRRKRELYEYLDSFKR
jgi:hypothetical protein